MSVGRLRRKLDLDLIARMEVGVVLQSKPLKHASKPRDASTYRAAWRNRARQNTRRVPRQLAEAA